MSELTSPSQLADKLERIGAEQYKLGKELNEIKQSYFEEFLLLRAESTSDKQAEMKWRATDKGKRATYLEMELKGIEALRRGYKDRLRVLEGESRNIY